jgi:hypothetical protein
MPFWPWFLLAGFLGFAVTIFITSARVRAYTWLLAPIALGVIATQIYGIFFIGLPLILFVWLAFISTGSGIAIGHALRKKYPPIRRNDRR